MTRTVAKVDLSQSGIVSALRALGHTVIDTHAVGGGFPDLVCILRDTGKVLLIECKTPGNVRFTPAECQFILKLVNPVYRVVDTPEQAIEIVMEGDK